MEKVKITEDAVAAYSICQRKSFQILFQYKEGKEQNYATYLRERIQDNESHFFRPKKCLPFSSDKFKGNAEFISNAAINSGNLLVVFQFDTA